LKVMALALLAITIAVHAQPLPQPA
jgi:hypothetical protein